VRIEVFITAWWVKVPPLASIPPDPQCQFSIFSPPGLPRDRATGEFTYSLFVPRRRLFTWIDTFQNFLSLSLFLEAGPPF